MVGHLHGAADACLRRDLGVGRVQVGRTRRHVDAQVGPAYAHVGGESGVAHRRDDVGGEDEHDRAHRQDGQEKGVRGPKRLSQPQPDVDGKPSARRQRQAVAPPADSPADAGAQGLDGRKPVDAPEQDPAEADHRGRERHGGRDGAQNRPRAGAGLAEVEEDGVAQLRRHGDGQEVADEGPSGRQSGVFGEVEPFDAPGRRPYRFEDADLRQILLHRRQEGVAQDERGDDGQ